MKRDAERRIILAARKQLRKTRFQGSAVMDYAWREPNRRRDKDNIAFAKKFVQDALVHAGFLKGDGWAYAGGFSGRFGVDPGNPRVEVEIREAAP